MLRLVTLGRLAISEEGAAGSATTQRSRLLVLAMLAVAGERGVSRERLQALLWPEADAEHARKALNQALFALRRDLATPDLVIGNGDLRLNSEVITSDLHAFEAALNASDYEQAVNAYGGAFLDGAALRTSADADHWVERERARLQTAWQGALRKAAEAAQARGDPHTAVRHWKQLAASDPLTPATAVGLMRALAEAGDPAGAVAHARVHELLVRQELETDAAPEVMTLAQEFQAQRTANALVPPVHVPTPVTSTSFTAPVPPDPVPGDERPSERPRARRWRESAALGVVLACIAMTVGWSVRDTSAVRTTALAGATTTSLQVPRVAAFADPSERDREGDSSPTVLTDIITRRLTESGTAAVVALPGASSTNALLSARQAGARLLIQAHGISPRERMKVTVWNPATRELLWAAELGDGSPDSLAERSAAAVAVRLDPRTSRWIASSSQPTSLDSYQSFVRGLAAYVDHDAQAALAHFDAAARDTSFTMALVMSGWAHCNVDGDTEPASIVRRLRTRRLAPLDYALTEHMAHMLSDDVGAEHNASIAVGKAAPQSEWLYVQAYSAMKMGRATEVIQLLEAMPPDLGWLTNETDVSTLHARALHMLARHERELAVATEARRRFPTDRIVLQTQLKALAALGRIAAVDSIIDYALTLKQKLGWNDEQPMQQTILELDAHGYHDAAKRLAARTHVWITAQPLDRQKIWGSSIADLRYYADDVEGARHQLQQLLIREPRNSFILEMLGVIYAQRGDVARAREMERRLAGIADASNVGDVLIIRAGIMASLGDRDSAIRMITDAYRAGFAWRTTVHIQPGLRSLRGYRPFEQLIAPVE